jgi:hypothetical protein
MEGPNWDNIYIKKRWDLVVTVKVDKPPPWPRDGLATTNLTIEGRGVQAGLLLTANNR